MKMRTLRNVLIVGIGLLMLNGCGSGGGELLTPAEFNSRIHATTQVQLIDVRTPEEYAEGHLKGAVNIDFNSDDFVTQIESQTKTMAIYVYCRSGKRSAAAAGQMSELGFTQVFDMDGGVLSWQERGLQVVN